MTGLQSAATQNLDITLVPVATGLTRPVVITHASDDSGRLFIAQQTGEVLVLAPGATTPSTFLDISGPVRCCGERGLLGLAFHPQYSSNGFFYVHYSDSSGDTVLERYQVSPSDPDVGNASSAETVLTQDQPFSNHNGGTITFGPDGYLYVFLGDGGDGGDPQDNALDITDNWLGKILRIDVDGDDFPMDDDLNYAVPGDNPFVGLTGDDEIWAYGLRNPWRASFDRLTGDLWFGDVGQGAWEEINFQPAASILAENYGWDVLEGGLQAGTPGPSHPNCFEDDPGGDGSCADFLTGGSVLPVLEYAHTNNPCDSISGGFRYRGAQEPRLWGIYFNGDYCYGDVRAVQPNCSGGWNDRVIHEAPSLSVASFGEDEVGEVYVTEYSQTVGQSSVHRIAADPTSGGPQLTPDQTLLDFGSLTVGGSTTVGLTLENTGTGVDDLVVEFLTLTDGVNFSLDLNAGANPCGVAPLCLASGDDCTLNVTFEPQREGGFDERLLVPANSAPAPVTLLGGVACTGTNGPSLSNNTISNDATHTACDAIAAGPNLVVDNDAILELRAGNSIGISGPLTVAPNAGLRLVIDPVLAE